MNVTIVHLSQTGNTKKVAQRMAETLEGAGHAVRLVPLRGARAEDLQRADLVGVGAPVWASQAPAPVRAFLAAAPSLGGRRAFVFATSGGAPGKVLTDLAEPLRRAGADVVGGAVVRGECFYPAPCIVGRYPGRPNAADLDEAERFVASVERHVGAGVAGPLPDTRPEALRPKLDFYSVAARMMTDAVIRRTMPVPRVDVARCKICKTCVAACPVGCIEREPAPRVGEACVRCYHCMVLCPQKALSVDWAVPNAILWSVYNETFERWLGDVRPGEAIY